MTLQDRLKKIRKDAGLRQSSFADKVGLGQKTLSNYETGRNQPGEGRLFLIAEKFGVNPQWLLTGEGEQYLSQHDVDAKTKARIEREHIRRLFSELSPETQRIILDVLRKEVGMARIKNNAEVNGDVSGDVIINQE